MARTAGCGRGCLPARGVLTTHGAAGRCPAATGSGSSNNCSIRRSSLMITGAASLASLRSWFVAYSLTVSGSYIRLPFVSRCGTNLPWASKRRTVDCDSPKLTATSAVDSGFIALKAARSLMKKERFLPSSRWACNLPARSQRRIESIETPRYFEAPPIVTYLSLELCCLCSRCLVIVFV